MLTYDIHTHSVASGHGTTDTIADMAKHAAVAGIQVLGISDHGPATLGAGTTSYFRSLAMAPKTRAGVSMLYGIELNILNGGGLDLDNSILSGLDYAIASMHKPPRKPASSDENTADYIKAMQNPYVKILGHCDNTQFPVDYFMIVEAARENNIIIEVNNASLLPGGYHQMPGTSTRNNYLELLRLCMERSIAILISSDSHGSAGIGNASAAEELVRQINYPESLIVNEHPELLMRRK
ncbi:MAG: PHP domain-containing protein [Lachnospiraceae bacterium]|nr:PHP domain-containing protein [Lachnospiraceae bacterium]